MFSLLLGVPLALATLLYLILLVTPIPLPFMAQQVRNLVISSMPEGSQLELGEMALALEGYVWPVVQFRPVVYTDLKTGGTVRMDALEVGFSPVRALIGQPGATVTIVRPHLQVNQDIFGPRLAKFDIVEDPEKGTTVRVIEGEEAFPVLDLSSGAVDVTGKVPDPKLGMRSDNDWLVYNLEAAESGIGSIIEQAKLGNFSRLVVRGGTLQMNDALYGVFRTFRGIRLDVAPSADMRHVTGSFAAEFSGTVMNGTLDQVDGEDGVSRLQLAITNLDLGAFVPRPDDADMAAALVGSSAVSIDVGFDDRGKLTDGVFRIDMTGTDLRIGDQYYPIANEIVAVDWEPATGTFTMGETQVSIGNNTGYLQGVFRLGFDEKFGPLVAMSMTGRDVSITSDVGAPQQPFSTVRFTGWSAPLYGATGIDQFQLTTADGGYIESTGRMDMLLRGAGFQMDIKGDGISAEDVKRVWPPFLAADSRTWFVKNVVGGKLKASSMSYNFPVGAMDPESPDKPLPPGAVSIDLVGEGVQIKPTETMAPITINGETRLTVRDTQVTIAADGASLATPNGDLDVANVALVIGSEHPSESLFEISGDFSGDIPALIGFAKQQMPDAFAEGKMPVDVTALAGGLSMSLVSTIVLDKATGTTKSMDYAINGVVQDFASTTPIENHTISAGQLSFVASQAGYRVSGQAVIDGLSADIVVDGALTKDAPPPNILLSSTLDASEFKKMGFDVSQFLSGEVKFVAKPMSDGSIQLAVDLQRAALTIKDLGITKQVGTAGSARAAVRQSGEVTDVSKIDIAFGDVKLEGGLQFDAKKGLQAADFSEFALSAGDAAQLSLRPSPGGGYQVRLRGDQLDMKPMLKRFFSLADDSTGGPQATAVDQTITVDVELKRALGFYRTTAFNLNLDMKLRGSDMQNVSLQANLGEDRSISIATNPGPNGSVMTVAFNDLGTLLRLLNVYPNLQGGAGSLVMETGAADKVRRGTFTLKDFIFANDATVAQIVGGHAESRRQVGDNLSFKSGEVEFVWRSDRVEITDAVLAGQMVGGTARGFIYTDKRQYDMTGTYVPLFGLNNAFQKLPIFGPLLGGRRGEGLFGVTFAIRGPLDKPDFKINPISALVPGGFRKLFEYRAREIPRVE